MEAHGELLLDQLGDPPGGPQPGGVTQRFRPPLQGAFELPALRGREPRRPPRAPRLLQPGPPASGQLLRPATHGLAMHAHPSRDFGRLHPGLQQPGRFQAPAFQRIEIPLHPRRITHATQGSRSAKECHYILRGSIGR